MDWKMTPARSAVNEMFGVHLFGVPSLWGLSLGSVSLWAGSLQGLLPGAPQISGSAPHNCQFAEHLYSLRGVFRWKTQGFQGEGGDATTSGGIMGG